MRDASSKLARWHLRLLQFELYIVHESRIKQLAADPLSFLHTTGTDESPLGDNILVLTLFDRRYGNRETEMDKPDRFDQIWIDELNIKRPEIPDVLQGADGTHSEKPLTTTDFVPAQATEPYCKEVAMDAGKLRSIYTYDHNGFLIRQSRLDQALKKIVPASFERVYYIRQTIQSLPDTRVKDEYRTLFNENTADETVYYTCHIIHFFLYSCANDNYRTLFDDSTTGPYGQQRHVHDNIKLSLMCHAGVEIPSWQTFTTVISLQPTEICGHGYNTPVAKDKNRQSPGISLCR